MTQFCLVTARMTNAKVQIIELTDEQKSSKEWKKKNITGAWPLLETDQGIITESVAISKYLARQSTGPDLLGGTALQKAQIEQWMSYCLYHVRPNVEVISQTIFGDVLFYQEEFN